MRIHGVRDLTQKQATSNLVLECVLGGGLLACFHAEFQSEGSSIWALMR